MAACQQQKNIPQMTDKNLYQHIRKLVREQKEQHVLDSKQDNFAQEYCKKEILKKKQLKNQENRRVSNLFKNFRKVESYINIMDIINNLPLHLNKTSTNLQQVSSTQDLPEILPKSIQMKIKEELGPILNMRYEEEREKREELITSFRQYIDYSNEQLVMQDTLLREVYDALDNNRMSEKLDIIDILRKDIKRKQIYFIERRFDREMEDIEKIPQKVENTKIFHKICSYLHMILEQEHKQKWASKKDKQIRQEYRKDNIRKKFRIPTLVRTTTNPILKQTQSKTYYHNRFRSTVKENHNNEQVAPRFQSMNVSMNASRFYDQSQKKAQFEQNACCIEEQNNEDKQKLAEKSKKVQSKQELLKQSFTFRKRGIKAALMTKINLFVDNVNDEQKKNLEVSKKYGKALQSLGQQLKTSYGRFEREQIAQEEDIEDMKRYLDNTLSRNKKDLKKFHHR